MDILCTRAAHVRRPRARSTRPTRLALRPRPQGVDEGREPAAPSRADRGDRVSRANGVDRAKAEPTEPVDRASRSQAPVSRGDLALAGQTTG